MRNIARPCKKYLFLLGCIVLAAFWTPSTAVAGETGERTVEYNSEDMKVVKSIIESSPTLTERYQDQIDKNFPDWESIGAVTWGAVDGDAANLYRVTELHLNDISDLNELDVSGLKYLQELECGNTSITKLDLSANTALEILDCNNTGITALNLSYNEALQSLDCSNTGIEMLDLTKNTALERLICNDTSITALSLSNNKKLTDLYCNTIVSPAGQFSLEGMDHLENFRIGFVGSEIAFVSCSGHEVSLSIPEEVQVESVYTCATDENGYPVKDENGKVQEKLMWYVLSAPEDYVCLRYTGLSKDIRFEDGKGTNVTIDTQLDIEARIVTEEEMQPGIGIEGVVMNPVYHSSTLNYAATVGHDVSKVTLTGALASTLPDAVYLRGSVKRN